MLRRVILLAGLGTLGLFFAVPRSAVAANPTTINFQGKVVNNSAGTVGTNVADTSHTIVFRLYNTISPTIGGTCVTGGCLWEETDTATTVNGIFQVELGNSGGCSFFTPAACNNSTAIDFSSDSLYLTMKFDSDTAGFMTPLIHFTGVPYAYYAGNSAALGGLAATNFVQLAQGLQTDASTTNASIAINKTGSTANILTLQKSSANVLLLDNNGLLTLQPAASMTAGQSALTQTITNASSTGGTVNGYSQTITVANSTSASTTNGFNISLTDNGSLANTNRGVNVNLAGSNTNQGQIGFDSTVNAGFGIRGVSTGASTGGGLNCGGQVGYAAGVCGVSTATNGIGLFGVSSGEGSNGLNSIDGAGVTGYNNPGTGVASSTYAGVRGIVAPTNAAAYKLQAVYGQAKGGAGSTVYGGYFTLQGSSATAGAALYASNDTASNNILVLQDNTTSVFTVGDGGLISLQPAASLINGQSEVAQTFTNGSSTGGTVNGYSQTITVANSTSASTTNGFNVSLTDNSSALTNTNTGLKITIAGSNVARIDIGANITVGKGLAINAISSNTAGTSYTCVDTSTNKSIGICTGGADTGIYATGISGGTSLTDIGGAGLIGKNTSSAPSASDFVAGVKGITSNGFTNAYTSIGVFGQAKAGSNASAYGGYFNLSPSSSATAGAALYASNSTVAANILQLQDNTTDVLTVADGGAVTISPSGNNAGTIVRQTSGTATSGNVFDVQTANGTSHFIQIANSAANEGAVTIQSIGATRDLTLDSGSGIVKLGGNSTSLQKSASSFTLDIANAGTSTLNVSNSNGSNVANLSVSGDIAAGSGHVFKVGATSGSTISTCGANNYVSSFASNGGIITGGSCTTIPSGGYTTIQDEGSALTQRDTVNFTGSGVSCADNAGSSRTDCTISGGGGGTLASDYNSSGTTGNTISLSASGGGVILQDAGSPSQVSGDLLDIKAATADGGGNYLGVSSSAISLQDTAGNNALVFDSVNSVLKVYANVSSPTNYISLSYDNATSTGILAVSTGTIQLGSSVGAINITAGTGFGIAATGHANSSLTTDSGNLTLDAAGTLNVGTASSTILIGQTSGGTTTVQSASGLVLGTTGLAGQLGVFNGTNKVTIEAGASTTTYNFILPASSGTNNYCLVNTSTPGTLQWLPCGAGSTGKVTLTPEYAGAVMTADGTSNTGTMTSDFCSGSSLRNIPSVSNPCAATAEHNYYTWVTTSQNDYDIWVRWQVPTDFADFAASNAIQMYGWRTDSTATTSVTLSVYNSSGTQCGTSTNVATGTATWTQTTMAGTVTAAGCTISAGNVIDLRIQMAANNKTVRAGEITINYNRQ